VPSREKKEFCFDETQKMVLLLNVKRCYCTITAMRLAAGETN